MRTLILTSILLLCSTASAVDTYHSYEQTINGVTYGYSPRGTYTRQQIGPITVHQVQRNPEPAWKSTYVPPTKISYGTRPRSYRRSGN